MFSIIQKYRTWGTRTFFYMVDQYFGNDSLEPFQSIFIGSTWLAMAPNQRLNRWNYLGVSFLDYENIERFTRRAVVNLWLIMLNNLKDRKMVIYLVQKYGGRYFEKVKRIYILSRSMEADILKKYCSLIYFIL